MKVKVKMEKNGCYDICLAITDSILEHVFQNCSCQATYVYENLDTDSERHEPQNRFALKHGHRL